MSKISQFEHSTGDHAWAVDAKMISRFFLNNSKTVQTREKLKKNTPTEIIFT